MKCHYCAEEIPDGAVKCPACEEILDSKLRQPRTHRPPAPEVQRLESAAGRSLAWAVLSCFFLWIAGLVLGPLWLWLAAYFRRRARQLNVAAPSATGGLVVCGYIMLAEFAIFLAVAIPTFRQLQLADLWVDNGYSSEIVVEMDGERISTVPAQGASKVQIREGMHHFRAVTQGGAVLGEMRGETLRTRKYLYNPGGKNQYYIVKATYYVVSPVFAAGPTEEDKGKPEWLDVSNMDYVLEPLPNQIDMSQNESRAERTALARRPGKTEQ